MSGFNRGGGMGNMQNMLREAQKMQEQMQLADQELEDLEVVGLAGGGEEGDETVVVYMNGKKVINGYKKADEVYNEKMGPFAKAGGGLLR